MSEEIANAAAIKAKAEHQALLDRVATGLNLSGVVDEGLREKWEALREVTADEARHERMAESLLITHHALL